MEDGMLKTVQNALMRIFGKRGQEKWGHECIVEIDKENGEERRYSKATRERDKEYKEKGFCTAWCGKECVVTHDCDF